MNIGIRLHDTRRRKTRNKRVYGWKSIQDKHGQNGYDTAGYGEPCLKALKLLRQFLYTVSDGETNMECIYSLL